MSEQTTKPDIAAAPVQPSLAEQIRALLPDHTHQAASGIFTGLTTWWWSTPCAVWTVALNGPGLFGLGAQSVDVTGNPGGEWRITGDAETIVRRLGGVLRALDAIADGGREPVMLDGLPLCSETLPPDPSRCSLRWDLGGSPRHVCVSPPAHDPGEVTWHRCGCGVAALLRAEEADRG